MARALGICILVLLAPPAKKPDVENPGGFWKPLPAAKAGDWRWRYPERGQTFAEYKEAAPTRPTARRQKIYLQPLLTRPPRDAKLLERITAVLEGFYLREVAVLKRRPLPRKAYHRSRRQVDIFRLVPTLVGALPPDGLLLLAVTDRDLFVGKMLATFGWGSFELRVAVMSTRRLYDRASGTDGALKARLRIATLAAHEAGHALSLPHCIFYGCLMNGARSVEEADRRPPLLCPVCRAKVCWNLGLDPLKRYDRLARGYERAGLPEAASKVRGASNVTRLHEKD